MYLPQWMDLKDLNLSIWWVGITLLLVVGQFALRQFACKQEDALWFRAVRATLRPFFLIVGLMLFRSGIHLIADKTLQELMGQTLHVLLVAAGTWWILAAAKSVKNSALLRFDISVADNFLARQMHTRLGVLYRIFTFIVILVAAAVALMTFEAVRALGASLLAGAGVTGLILGFAAQKTLGSVFAGIQIALTQPIKIDDVVVIEDEWGRIEEITLTYVVVKIWDMRRLIVPITYFVDKPIQNWTRREAEIIGQVVLYTDYRFEVEPMRAELTRLLKASPHWNGNVNVLQVVDAGPSTITVRALMSAKDSPTTWNLRCDIREGLIRWLQQNQPEALPVTRVELPKGIPAEPETRQASTRRDRTRRATG